MNKYEDADKILNERFGRDCLVSVATVEGSRPHVRVVNSYYEDGEFHVVTNALSNKMRQIAAHPEVAVCGMFFTAHGMGEDLGHLRAEGNAAAMAKLRKAFAPWYEGNVNEDDPHLHLLRIRLTDGLITVDEMLDNVSRMKCQYNVDFVNRTAAVSTPETPETISTN